MIFMGTFLPPGWWAFVITSGIKTQPQNYRRPAKPSWLKAFAVEKKMQAPAVDVESHPFARLSASVSASSGDQIGTAAFDVKKSFRTEIIDEFYDCVDRCSVGTGHVKILGTNTKR
jgi:hypothetical protein